MTWPVPLPGFAAPAGLLLLLPLALLLLAGFFLKKRLSRKFEEFFGGERLLAAAFPGRKGRVQGALLACALALMVLALARPVLKTPLRAYNFMALVDITQSMWVADYQENGSPASRLEMAKRNLAAFLKELPSGSRFGLAVFAGKRESVFILTPPQEVGRARPDLMAMIQGIDYSWTWDDATAIKDSLSYLAALLEKNRADYGTGLTLVVLTDGEETPGPFGHRNPFDPHKFGGMHFHFAGHGTVAGAPVPQFDEQWRLKQERPGADRATIISRLDERNLQEMAKLLNGSYRRIEAGTDLAVLARDEGLKTGTYEVETDVRWVLWLASLVLIFLFALL